MNYSVHQNSIAVLICVFLCTTMLSAQDSASKANSADNKSGEERFTVLRDIAESRLQQLRSLVADAEKKGIETSREHVTVVTAEQFLKFADWDHAHPEELEKACAQWWKLKDRAEPYARELPARQLREVMAICDQAISDLQSVIDDPKWRRPVPTIDHARLQIKQGYFHDGDTPWFPSSFTWMPREPELLAAYGDINGSVITPGAKKSPQAVARVNIADREKSADSMGYVFMAHTALPMWAIEANTNIDLAQQCFTKYDIDHPGARDFWRDLLADTVPQVAGTTRSRGGYMLANEPHWYTATEQWDSHPVSEFTKDKFRVWLAKKHNNKIESLNQLWKTEFDSFDDITIEIPIDRELRGTPIWFDWCRFNMDRVTEYFHFLDDEVKRHDPDAMVHIKTMTEHWSNDDRSSGIDMEALIHLQDIVGCDAKLVNASGAADWEKWPERYAVKWEEVSLSFDFYKSIAPQKLIFDSEFHGLTTVHWRDENLSAQHTNCVLWLIHMHGLGMNQTWYWGREADGSPKMKAANAFYGSNLTQPLVLNQFGRTMKDLNAFAPEVIAFANEAKHVRLFYSETDAINDSYPLASIKHTYEQLYHLGHPIGFATGQMLRDADGTFPDGVATESSLLIANDVNQVTNSELAGLQNYLDNGGSLLLIGDANFSMDEYGRPHKTALKADKVRLTKLTGGDVELIASTKQFLTDADLDGPINVLETNDHGKPGCVWRTIPTDNGHLLLVLNLGNTTANLIIEEKSLQFRDLLSGTPQESPFQLESLGVKLLEAKSNGAR